MDKDAEPTHEEIWDDSALVNSWNQALEEYKVRPQPQPRHPIPSPHRSRLDFADLKVQKYHSIHARGGRVEDLLDSDVK